jgi:hypothetical protein
MHFDGRQLWRRCNRRADLASAARVEAVVRQFNRNVRAHSRKQRQEGALQEVEGRRAFVVSSTGDADAAGCACGQQGRQNRLQNERATAGGADCKRVSAGLELAGPESKLARTDGSADDFAVADFRCGVYGGQVLAHQAGLLAIRADVGDAKGLLRANGKRKRRAQNLPAAFAL